MNQQVSLHQQQQRTKTCRRSKLYQNGPTHAGRSEIRYAHFPEVENKALRGLVFSISDSIQLFVATI